MRQPPFKNVPEHMQALGEMTASFASLESEVSQLIWILLGDDPKVGQIVTVQLSFQRQLDLLGALFKHKFPDSQAALELDQILAGISTVEQKRNVLTHSQFILGTAPDSLFRYKATAKRSPGLKNQFERLMVTNITEVTDQLNQLANELYEFQGRYLRVNVL